MLHDLHWHVGMKWHSSRGCIRQTQSTGSNTTHLYVSDCNCNEFTSMFVNFLSHFMSSHTRHMLKKTLIIIISSHCNKITTRDNLYIKITTLPSVALSLLLSISFIQRSSVFSGSGSEQHPEEWVIISLHLVVIMLCSVFLFLSSVVSVMADKTQQQTLIYTEKICFFCFLQLYCALQLQTG